MDPEEIGTRTAELASRFGVAAPRVELGPVPSWCADGMRPQVRAEGTVLIVGSAYETLEPEERRGALAQAVLALDLHDAGRFQPIIAALFAWGLSTAMLGLPFGTPSWQATVFALVPCALTLLAVHAVRSRRIVYDVDHRMTAVLGPATVAAVLDLDERSRTRARGLGGAYVRLVQPSRTRRARRLEGEPPPA